jgi:uncharacterized membrane protein YbaN (DUF454 family)
MALRQRDRREAGRVPAVGRDWGDRDRLSPARRRRRDNPLLPEERARSGTRSFDAPFRESIGHRAEAIAPEAPNPVWPAITPAAVAAPCHCREHTKGRAERDPHVAGPWVRCCEQHGAIEIHDPRLLRPDRAAFCRALVEAAVARFGARRAEVRMESSTCRLEFEPGRFDRAELADRAAAAVRAATPSLRDRAGSRDSTKAGRDMRTVLATEDLTSTRGTREATPGKPVSAGRPLAAPTGSRNLTDFAMAGGCFALAVGGIILPGIPTLPFLIMSGRYAIRVSPTVERLLMSRPWCAELLRNARNRSGRTIDPRSLLNTIALGVLFAGAFLIIHPPLPVVMGLELGLMAFLGWRELDSSACRQPGQLPA